MRSGEASSIIASRSARATGNLERPARFDDSWFGAGGRFDHVRLDSEFNRRAFNILTARALFHTDWQSRDEFAVQYSHFVYGREVNVAHGFPPVDDPSLNPDRDVFSLSATFWW